MSILDSRRDLFSFGIFFISIKADQTHVFILAFSLKFVRGMQYSLFDMTGYPGAIPIDPLSPFCERAKTPVSACGPMLLSASRVDKPLMIRGNQPIREQLVARL